MALVRRLAIRYAFAMPDVESLLGEIAALRMMVAERDARLAELARSPSFPGRTVEA